jgi:branched-chain amino acid transport system ATP-binding protein
VVSVAGGAGSAASASVNDVLRTEGVGKRFGGFQALREVDMRLGHGEILGVIGPNGAGKTTLFNVIAGMFRPTEGKIFFDGRDVTGAPPHKRMRMGIARTFQLIRPFTSMTIFENVATAALGGGASFKDAGVRATAAIERLNMGAIATKSAAGINAVEGKRLEVARALASSPKIVLLDEIFSGLNTDEVQELVALVHSLREDGISIIVIEHNVHAIKSTADRVLAFDAGRVVSEGSPEHVLSDPHVIESYLGQRTRA